MSDTTAQHPVFEEISRLALAMENEELPSEVVAAFERFMVTMPDTAAAARAAPTPSDRDAILDRALNDLRRLQHDSVVAS